MRSCPHCGAATADGAVKCLACGSALRLADKETSSTEKTVKTKAPRPPGRDSGPRAVPRISDSARKAQLAPPLPRASGPERKVAPEPAVPVRTDESPQRKTPYKFGETESSEGVTASASDPLIGQTPLGQYRILRKIGEGGFGAVYIAEQLGVGRNAVIKVLRKRHVQSEHFIKRFEREAAVLAALDHHHLVRLYNFGEMENGELFLAMEYGGDRTLADEIARTGPLAVERALRIGEQVCAALEEAHEHGIVHRDLKPPNILLGDKGGRDWIKVVDVGIAKILDDSDVESGDASLTASGALIGTPAYFSPEQARGLPVDVRSDVYAIGIVLYEMLTAKLPVHGATPLDFARAHASDAPAPMRTSGVHVPPAVEAVVAKALQKDPAKRYPSAQELADALADARRALKARSPWRRNVVIPAALGVGLGGVALVIALRPAARPAPEVEVERATLPPPAPAPVSPAPAPTAEPAPAAPQISQADKDALRLLEEAAAPGQSPSESIAKLQQAKKKNPSLKILARVYAQLANRNELAGDREEALYYYGLCLRVCPPDEKAAAQESIHRLKN